MYRTLGLRSRIDTPKPTMEVQDQYVARSGVFIVNFEQISHIVLVFSLLTLTK